ncbi:MAG: pectinesterase family protein [Opitutaceae bacterium]
MNAGRRSRWATPPSSGWLVFLACLLLAAPARALTLTTLTPADGATMACADTLVRLTFDEEVRLGAAGIVQLVDAASGEVVDSADLAEAAPTRLIGGNATPYRYLPLVSAGRGLTFLPRGGVLAAGRTYRLRISPGAIATAAGVPFAGFAAGVEPRFTVRAAGPAADASTLVVAADGSGDFCTVQGAIDFVPLGNTRPRLIAIRPGVYPEMIYIGPRRPFLTLRGADRDACVIAYANNNNFNAGNNRAMVAIDANDVALEFLTLHNTTPRGGSQAEALRGNGRRVVLDRVTLRSFQDTLLWNGALFVTDSLIEGDVDFMWGGGACFFQRCEIRSVSAGYLAQVRNAEAGRGNVYVDCRLTAAPGVTNVYLARIDPRAGVANTWPYSEVVFLGCAMGPHIRPEGWLLNNATAAPDSRFWEAGSTDLEGSSLDLSRRLADSRRIDAATAARYRDPEFVLGWSPPPVRAGAPVAERLTGLSTRARVGNEPVIVGFVVAGAAAKPVLVRGVGPTLGLFGVADALARPRIELVRGSEVIGANAGWSSGGDTTGIAAAAVRAGLFPLDTGSADSALRATLAPAAYTAVITDAAGRGGNGLVEIYDLAAADGASRLANLSARAVAGAGEAALIAGFTIAGTAPKAVLLRAIGPALGAFGVEGALRKATLTLYRGQSAVAVNAGWTASADALEIARLSAAAGAFPLVTGSGDAALLVRLEPGNYTAQVTGGTGESGVALLEVYEAL